MRAHRGALFAALLAALLATVPGASAQEQPPPPDVLLITIDTLRPDALGFLGGPPTPTIDRLAAKARRFPDAVSPAPLTAPTHASLLTGLVPRRHGVRANGQPLPHTLPSLPAVLAAAGYRTAAAVSGYPLARASGLHRGFHLYDDRFDPANPEALERRAGATSAAALALLQELDPGSSPFFLWVHYYDPHDPYDPPEELRLPGPRGAYDGEVQAVDRALGTLLQALDARFPRPRLTVLTSDHGESLGEHGEATHGFFAYQSTLAVPLLFHYPGVVPEGQDATAVRLIDIAPTVLQLLRLPRLDQAPGGDPQNPVDGVDLWPLLKSHAWLQPPATSESLRPQRSYGWAPLRTVRQGQWKLIAAPRPELYNLDSDPGETRNLVRQERAIAHQLAELLEIAESRPARATAGTVDAQTLARLRSLGYTGGGSTNPLDPSAADPKDRVTLWNRLGEAEAYLTGGNAQAALQGFRGVLAEDPKNPYALARAGAALLTLGSPGEAAQTLRRAAERRPEHSEIRRDLARALLASGNLEEGIEAAFEWVRLEPGNAEGWILLGNALGTARKPQDAVQAFHRATELHPERPDYAIRLGFALFGAGEAREAADQLLLAARLTGPQAFPNPSALGLLLLRLGDTSAARTWLTRGQPTEGDYAEGRYALARLEAQSGRPEAAREFLSQALKARPDLRPRAEADPVLAPLNDSP